MTVKLFQCENCESKGKIIVRASHITNPSEICFCPICGASIYEEDEEDDDDEEL